MDAAWHGDEEQKVFEQADDGVPTRAHEVTLRDEEERRKRRNAEQEHERWVKEARSHIDKLQMAQDDERDAQKERLKFAQAAEDEVAQEQRDMNNQLADLGSTVIEIMRRSDRTGVNSGDFTSRLNGIVMRAQDEHQLVVSQQLNVLRERFGDVEEAHHKQIHALDDEIDEWDMKSRTV